MILHLVFMFAIICIANAGDPNILTEFIAPNNTIDANYFTFTGMRQLVGGEYPTTFKALKVTMNEFPTLNGQSVSYVVLEFPIVSINPVHIHPRASELMFLVSGSLQVGFVDTSNTLYKQTLQIGDIFVFPKGLVHFQYNNDTKEPALAISAFGSANAGTQSIPTSVFNTSIFEGILDASFHATRATLRRIEDGLKG
ncbi:putative germin, rmlC-like cupin domain superfamily, rmlC-like jelly roll [Helianthus annuus]|nr:putative germin, rmlC-like cupin domain superfamily, rmlC-like jelly roll [Helianthus annuus]